MSSNHIRHLFQGNVMETRMQVDSDSLLYASMLLRSSRSAAAPRLYYPNSVSFCLSLAIAVILSACTNQAPRATTAAAPVDPELVILDPAPVQEGRLKWVPSGVEPVFEALMVTGRIGVNENLTSRVGAVADGRIVAVFANVGDNVKKGQLLAQLHSHEVHDARAEFAKARAELNRRKAELEFAGNARNRAVKLYDLKATSLEQVQRAETDLQGARLSITTAQAEINRIEEHLRHLGLTPEGAEEEYTKASDKKPEEGKGEKDYEEAELVPILAPIDGTILKRFISPGTVVTPASDLLLISDLSTLWVNAEVPEKNLGSLRLGRTVKIMVQAYGDRAFSGRITLIGDSLNPDTRTVQVRCQTENRERLLKPEMYAMVSFELGETRQALLVPVEAIQDIGGTSTVFVREGDTRFRARTIRTGSQSGSKIEVLEGLKTGELVVTAGSFLLKSELLKRQMSGD